MPIYQYLCRSCRKEFELLILPASKKAPKCPSCSGKDLEQLLAGFAVSSAEKSKAAFNAAKKKFEKGELRDKQRADWEEMQHHH